ncbi:MAG: response regulator [Bryobacteraceae bacterium]|nr:response regulator [Bryobacteraceae bacterium]
MSRAMVIDDSKAIRLILTRTLCELGYEVSQAANGAEALRSLERGPAALEGYTLILVDWNMPEMNGLEFVKRIRANEKYSDVKLMMVTTETQPEQMIAALEAGANEYVMKPFTREIIEDKLRLLGALQ